MSIEVTFHPANCSKSELRAYLLSNGFTPTEHLWDWPSGSIHFEWYDEQDFKSYDGVEATIFPPSEEFVSELGECDWALHTRTRSSASPIDREVQNSVIRNARRRFGGNFYNDSIGKNRYIQIESDGRDAQSRGIYLAYESIAQSISRLRFAIPQESKQFDNLYGTKFEPFTQSDPVKILYCALIPFAVAALEEFLKRCFVILLKYDSSAYEKIERESKKVEILDVIELASSRLTLEEIVASWYSFQNLNSTNAAFKRFCAIDFRRLLHKRRKIGSKIVFVDVQLENLIKERHELVHEFNWDPFARKSKIENALDLVQAVIEIFVDFLEQDQSLTIRD